MHHSGQAKRCAGVLSFRERARVREIPVFTSGETGMTDGREEKHEERPGTAGPVFYNTSAFFVRVVTFVVIPGFSPRLRGRDNQT